MTNLSMVGLRVEVARDTFAHVKKTLPPSLNTFPGEAEIKYYVKTTVVRPQFYKENIRSVSGKWTALARRLATTSIPCTFVGIIHLITSWADYKPIDCKFQLPPDRTPPDRQPK